MAIKTDSEMMNLLPEIGEEEKQLLKENIKQEGCRDPLIVWKGHNILLDGHNRKEICDQEDISYETTELDFADREAAKDWVIIHQAARRNLSRDQFREVVGRVYNRAKKRPGGTGANQHTQHGHTVQSANTAKEIGDQHGLSEKTVRRYGEFAQKVDEVKENEPETIERGEEAVYERAHEKVKEEAANHSEAQEQPVAQEQTAAEKQSEDENKSDTQEKSEPAKQSKGKKSSKPKFNPPGDRIGWAGGGSWNPITGCRHGCEYCYAAVGAKRFYSDNREFEPEFHEDRLNAPYNTKHSSDDKLHDRMVFLVSMGDMWGSWVPEDWITKVLDVCRDTPQWQYITFTKNPDRYLEFADRIPSNVWVGATADTQDRLNRACKAFRQLREHESDASTADNGSACRHITCLSCEPMLEPLALPTQEETDSTIGPIDSTHLDWLIIGPRSGTPQLPEKHPEFKWVENLLNEARGINVPVYMKPNLRLELRELPQKADVKEGDKTQDHNAAEDNGGRTKKKKRKAKAKIPEGSKRKTE